MTQFTRRKLSSLTDRFPLLREFYANDKSRYALIILGPMFILTVFAPIIVPHDPTYQVIQNAYASPSFTHPFGTDHLGRDIFSRVLMGGRVTLLLGIVSVGIATTFAVPIGIAAGYFGGKTDEILMRLMDVILSFPALILALLVVAVIGASLTTAILAIGFVYIPRIARVVRSSTLSVKNDEYVLAAKARNESNFYIMFFIILPNVVNGMIVEVSVRIGFAIIIGTSLSFLGLGTQPPTPDWGYMIAESRDHLFNSPYLLLFPSLFLGFTVMAFNLLGDGLRDILDPKVND